MITVMMMVMMIISCGPKAYIEYGSTFIFSNNYNFYLSVWIYLPKTQK